MTDHLSTLQIEKLCAKALPEAEFVAASVHTAKCRSCNQLFIEELKRQRGPIPFTFTLDPEFWFRDAHLDFDLLVALADKTLDEEMEEIVNIHLKTCETCREDVRSFLANREATAREMKVAYGPTYYDPSEEIVRASWWERSHRRAVYAVAAIGLMAVVVLIGVIALNKRSVPIEARKEDQPAGVEQSPGHPPPAPNVVSSPSNLGDSAKVAVLKDAGGEVTIDKNGRLTGLDEIPEKSRHYIAQAALSERIERADVLRRLSGEQSGLRGNDDGPQGFNLLYPIRKVVSEDRPVFRWESLPDVSSYQVYVLNADGNQVSQSEELPSTQTQWKAPGPLRRGQIFSWVVTAMVDGKKVISPSASAPEMKFAVLSTTDAHELMRLRKSNSHLALGVFYGRAGLLDEAEREFQNLIKLNPDSELPKKLVQSVRAIRKGT